MTRGAAVERGAAGATLIAREVVAGMETIDHAKFDLRRLHEALDDDKRVLRGIWDRVEKIRSKDDAKLAKLKEMLSKDLRGEKVLVFTYYKDTARYLYEQLGNPANSDW